MARVPPCDFLEKYPRFVTKDLGSWSWIFLQEPRPRFRQKNGPITKAQDQDLVPTLIYSLSFALYFSTSSTINIDEINKAIKT